MAKYNLRWDSWTKWLMLHDTDNQVIMYLMIANQFSVTDGEWYITRSDWRLT